MALLTKPKTSGEKPGRTEAVAEAANWQRSDSLFFPTPKDYDLVAQLTYMSALATANVGRENLFAKTAELGYSTSGYFHRVHLVAQRLNYDYARACQLVADQTKDDTVRSLLLVRDLMARHKLPRPSNPFGFGKTLERLPASALEHLPRKKDGGVNTFALGMLAAHAMKYSVEELTDALNACLDANVRLVTSGMEPKVVLTELIVRIAGGK